MSAASSRSPFRQKGAGGDSRLAATGRSGARKQIEGWAGRVRTYASALKIRAEKQVMGGPGGRQAPIFRQPEEREDHLWDSEAHAEAAGRRERTALMSGHGTVEPGSWHARSAIWRLTPRPWELERRMLRTKWVNRQGLLQDAAARNEQHE